MRPGGEAHDPAPDLGNRCTPGYRASLAARAPRASGAQSEVVEVSIVVALARVGAARAAVLPCFVAMAGSPCTEATLRHRVRTSIAAHPRMMVFGLLAAGLVCLPTSALGASRTLAPSAVIHGKPAYSTEFEAPRFSARRVVRLRGAPASAYVQEKERAAQLARAEAAVTAAGAPRRAQTPRTAVFGSLDAPGVSAASQIEELGQEGEATPPDTTGAIGPSEYIEFVNSEIVAYARTDLARIVAPTSITKFVGDAHSEGSACDPQIKYDPQSDRWFYAAIECNGTKTENALYVGFSKASEPTDLSTASGKGWCGYAYTPPEGGAVLEDYPKLGLDALHIILGTNAFNVAAKGEPFTTSHIFSLPKPPAGEISTCPSAPALTTFGSKASPLKTSLGHTASTPEPATIADGSSEGGYVVAADELTPFSGNGKNIAIWRVERKAEAPKLEQLGAPTVAEFQLPPSVAQPEAGDVIDSLDGRLTQAITAVDPKSGAEAIWTQHTVAGGGATAVRWYELRPGTLSVDQAGTISEAGKFAFNGAIAPTHSGGAVISYNTASSSSLVAIVAQSRIASAPPGTMNTPLVLGSSTTIDSDFSCPSQPLGKEFQAESCRWGDYAGESVDPLDPNIIWGSNQVNGPAGSFIPLVGDEPQWATRNYALTANDVPPTASFTISPNPVTLGRAVSLEAAASTDVDGTIVGYSWNFGDGSAPGSGATLSHTYTAPGTYTVTVTVADNGGETRTTSHQVTVVAPPEVSTTSGNTISGTTPVVTAASSVLTPNSAFTALGNVSVNPSTGAITFVLSVENAGTLSWLVTFRNGKFGVFAASAAKCRKGFLRLSGRCRPSRIAFAKGSKTIATPGTVSVTFKPSASALKALRFVLRHRRGLPVIAKLTFQSLLGGSPMSRTQSLTVRFKKK